VTRTDSSLSRFDRALRREGFALLAGLDEVGRGCLAGPVVAAAVILRAGTRLPDVDDSKQLTPEARETQAILVRARALAIGVGFVSARSIDAINIRQASLLAMRNALRRARVRVARDSVARDLTLLALVDGLDTLEGVDCPQRALVSGDARSLAIAAASVIAKTVRDRFMVRLGAEFPDYGFERHKGYGTEEHLAALERHGPCRWHRFSYAPVAQPSLFPA
jgi:ribonuclease HII